MQGDQHPQAGPSSGPHRMRITSAGSMKGYVTFALDFLKNHPDRPLVLHSLPSPSAQSKSAQSSSAKAASSDASRTLRPCTLVTPRLITIAEIIKRELMASYEKEGRGKGKHRAVGVWQYTETGLVPAELLQGSGGDNDEEADGVRKAGELARILGGKTRPKMTHHPFLQITLSTKPLGLEKNHDPDGHGGHTFITCQHVTIPRRRTHGEKRQLPADGAVQAGDVDDVGMSGGVLNGDDELGEVISRLRPAAAAGHDEKEQDLGAPVSRREAAITAVKAKKPVTTVSTVAALHEDTAADSGRPAALPKQKASSKLYGDSGPNKETQPTESEAAKQGDTSTESKPKKLAKTKDSVQATEKDKEKEKEKEKEKKRRRQASNAIDAEFAMFGKSSKKKKPSKP